MTEQNGRIRLSWGQIVWALTTTAILLGSWYDMRSQMALNRQAFDLFVTQDEKDKGQLWEAVKDVQAAVKYPSQEQPKLKGKK